MFNDSMPQESSYAMCATAPARQSFPLSELVGQLANTADQLDFLVMTIRVNMNKLGFASYDNGPCRIPNMEVLHKKLADGMSLTEALSDIICQVGMHADAISGIGNCIQQQLSDHQLGAKEAKQNAHR